ncbi:MAG: 23S rRNA (uracil(1939)-C(5))-methyltransferase RlmD [Candidatus Diapherotrites archaeon]|uniref:23S rRNA (Uracil(1939)-C(5))-methyltransferase RlmD n=1 Tax=Candidatus Iainarchaeum sp. TaxID=3101447 RepID=A0A8T3YMF1_9ARCH|nr:23S rRNA (uracil(1939)-C(5))-methyltransferase RlmD [Candidatus Diapherotrites archaeon]
MKQKDELKRIAAGLAQLHGHEPECAHQKQECNGCPLMGLSYEGQLAAKKEYLGALFGKEVEMEAAPAQFAYRNKADLSYMDGTLGYRRRDDHSENFALGKCWLLSEKANATARLTARLLQKAGIASADVMKRRKGLGYVTIRESRAGEQMLNFTFFGEIDESAAGICAELLSSGVQSVNLLLNRTWSDDAHGETVNIFGKEAIREEILGKEFAIRANTFFQTNAASAERIFGIVRGFVPSGASVLDLYCGVGTISMAVAEKCGKVLGVEISGESVAGAKENAAMNGIRNAEFIAGNVDEVLKTLPHEFGTVIADPPRSGLNAKTIRRMLRLGPDRIIYVSCNPAMLAQNIKQIEGFEVTYLRAFDQFPHTGHMEMLCVLEKAGK